MVDSCLKLYDKGLIMRAEMSQKLGIEIPEEDLSSDPEEDLEETEEIEN